MKIINILFFILLVNYGYSQEVIKGTNYTHFQLNYKGDKVDFAIADTNLTVKKPILLVRTGSQPVPLFIHFDATEDYPEYVWPTSLSNFDLNYLNKFYHVVVISKPFTPLIADVEQLNSQYNYITDTSNLYSYDVNYLKRDYLEYYVKTSIKVLKFLAKQKWVDNRKLVVFGHSQGSREAIGIANAYKKVTHVGLSGYDPLGRMDIYIRDARKEAEAGKITWEQADSITNEYIDFYKTVQIKDSLIANPAYINWNSYSKNTIDKLLNIKIPTYIVYGSNDITSDFCDLLPFYFIDRKLNNFVVKRIPNVEHNYFPLDKEGNPDYDKGKWIEVMNTFIDKKKKK